MQASGSDKRAILFADIAGSTTLYETLGDAAAKECVTRLQRLVASVAAEMGGCVQEIVGDEVMLTFAKASEAGACAVALQRRRDESSRPGMVLPEVRIGIHWGDVIADGDRLFGDTVNVAARVAAIAQGGQIIVTQAIVDQLPGELYEMVRPFDLAPVKGKREPVAVFSLAWAPQDLTTVRSLDASAVSSSLLRLVCGEEDRMLSPEDAGFVIGRSPSADLRVDWASVSRRHAFIEYQRGRFVLVDVSTNGTHVALQNGQTVFLRRESLPLWGEGRLSLGAHPDEAPAAEVVYHCL